VVISDQQFDIPIRYMYGEAIERWNSSHWPKAKAGRVKVDYVNLSMLLPDMSPYFPKDDARWKKLGFGEKIRVSLAKLGSLPWFDVVLQRTETSAETEEFYRNDVTKYGLRSFATPIGGNTYFAQDGRHLTMDCDNATEGSPSCRVKSDYRDGLVFQYTYSQDYLPQWQQIDDKLRVLFDQFATRIPTSSNK
jgi:hypothetical protein